MFKLLSRVFISLILFTMLTGCTAVPVVSPSVTPGQSTSPDAATFPLSESEATIPAKTPDAQSQLQRLRITNQSALTLHDLVVRFPDERIEFGDVPGGTTTEYRDVPQGVYRYAAYDVEVNGQKYQQPVVDWMGETPMQGEAFTYLIEADPSQWQTQGQVIQLVQVSTDQPEEVFLPVLSPTLHIGKGSPTSLAVSPDGHWVAASTLFGVYLYRTGAFAESWFAPLPEKVNGPISTLAWAPDGQHLAVAYGMDTGLILIWNAQTGEVEQMIVGDYTTPGLWWSPDGKTLFGPQSPDGRSMPMPFR